MECLLEMSKSNINGNHIRKEFMHKAIITYHLTLFQLGRDNFYHRTTSIVSRDKAQLE